MPTPTELFDLWQLADALATEAERVVSKALKECEQWGPGPSDVQSEVARVLRRRARECLKAASAAYRDRDMNSPQ